MGKLEFKGTLGSWIAEENMEEPRLDTIWSNEFLIAKTCYSPASKANAKLISAAPDLLQVCQKLIDLKPLIMYVGDVGYEHVGEAEAINLLFNEAEQAIQKALTL